MRYPGVRLISEATEEYEAKYEPIIINMAVNPPRVIAVLVVYDDLTEAMDCAKGELRKLEKKIEEWK